MGNLINQIYWYCTDFCINAANLIGISYVEWNIWLFLVFLPGLLLILFLLNIWRYFLKPILGKK